MPNPIHQLSPKLWYELRPAINRGLGLIGIFSRKYTPFLILTRSRSGSTLLTRALQSHPHVIARGEVLRTHNPSPEHVRNGPVESVRRVYIPYPRRVQAVGFKLFYWHNDDGHEAWKWLRTQYPALKIIHLSRENRLRVYVSLMISLQNQKWVRAAHSTTGSQQSKPVYIDVQKWHDQMHSVNAARDTAVSFFEGHDMLNVTYADLTKNWSETTKRIQTFLGVSPQTLKQRTIKQNPYRLSELIKNYDEVDAALTGSDYEWMLEK
jgi:LPS sulfotransferase NodH